VTLVRQEAGEVGLRIDAKNDVRPALVRALVVAGIDLLRLGLRASRLESIFIQLARGGSNDADTTGRPS
jgi:hypothetical protein